ncbi:MAG: hypothetical protein DMF91_10565 [Acidobacteria bacterium]|nr:MAG: hypothetical protein DMF91_10565 [Acidobacteriota bacterium]
MRTALAQEYRSACLVCGGDLALFGPYSRYTYYRCCACGTIQLFPMPNEADMAQAYRDEYASGKQMERYNDPEWYRVVSRTYADSIVRTLKDRAVSGPIVDCGAGWGFLVEMMIQSGFDARGVELSHDQVVFAQKRGLPIQQGDLASLTEMGGRASVVTLSCVFEHLVNHACALSAARRLLAPNGLLITLHPTASFYNVVGRAFRLGDTRKPLPDLEGAFAAPWHTALFSIDATEQFISRHGFRLLDIRPAPQGRHGGWVGLAQRLLELTNRIGWPLFRRRWPLVTSHIFVFERTD